MSQVSPLLAFTKVEACSTEIIIGTLLNIYLNLVGRIAGNSFCEYIVYFYMKWLLI